MNAANTDRLVHQILLGPQVQLDVGEDLGATRLLRQQGQLHPARRGLARRAGLDVRGRGIERFSGRERLAAGVVLEHLGDVRARRDDRAVRLGGGNECPDRPIRRLQIGGRDARDVVWLQVADAIAPEEEQAPVALRHVLAHVEADLVGGRELQFDLLQESRPCAIDFLGGRRILDDVVEDLEERGAGGVKRAVLAQLRRGPT